MEADGQASQLSEEMKMDQHLARLEQDARQSRLAMEAGGQASTKTCGRTEGAATAAQAMRGDCSSARRVEPGPTSSTNRVRRCRIQVVSPIHGDAHINSRLWLSSHRRCLQSLRDHPQRATSLVLLDRGD